MFCANCGKQINENDKFCPACGKPNAAAQPPAAGPSATTPGGSPETTPTLAPGISTSPAATVVVGSVPDFMVFSVILTVLGFICCCCSNPVTPALGIVGIIMSSNSRKKLAAGDVAGAEADANTAKIICWIALGLYVLVWLVSVISQLMGYQVVDPNIFYEFKKEFGNSISTFI